jgi:SulP family sulfate permease
MTSSAVGRQGWWRSLRERGGVARGDIAGGLTAALVLPAVEGGYGLIAYAPLGAELLGAGFLLGAFTAAVASIVSTLAGGRGPLLSGSSAALAVLVSSLVTALIADPRFLGADGRPFLPTILAFTALGVVLAGALQVALATMRLGGLVHFVPFPVHAGYINGSAVLMAAAMIPHALGLPTTPGSFDPAQAKWLSPLVALAALVVALRPPAWTRLLPPYLTALLTATGLYHLLALTPLAGGLGPLLTVPEFHWPTLDVMAPLAEHASGGLLRDKIWVLLQFAVAVAMMSSLQSALAGSTIDELTHKRRSSERELFAQGMANIAVGVIGAPPGAASTTRSKLNLDAGGATTMSRIVFGVSLLVMLALFLSYMNLLPMAAIAGVFFAVAIGLIDDWTRGATRVLWQETRGKRRPWKLLQSYAAMLLVAGVTVFVSLPAAIALGTLVAMVMFIRSNTKAPVRRVLHADRRSSRKVRPAAEAELLRQHGRRIAVVELDGALFFGTAEAADEQIEHLAEGSDIIVIDFERVTEVDASGARVMMLAAESVRRLGRQLFIAGLAPNDPRTQMIRDMDVHGRLEGIRFFPDADTALEAAEELLLGAVAGAGGERPALTLEQTLLGAGLQPEELQRLASLMIERRIAKGEAVFQRGDPGEAMYVSLQGQIGIWLPAAAGDGARARRMVSYAPGVAFGEIGLLQGKPRSADAIAEEDAVVLELPRAGYETIKAEHPALLSKMLLNLGLLLSSRVRALTDELEALQGGR